jgi:hypothetical protein
MSSSPRRTQRRTSRQDRDLLKRVRNLEKENKILKKTQDENYSVLLKAGNDIDETNYKISILYRALKKTTTLELPGVADDDFR